MEYYCYLRNVQDLLADGKTSCDRRFGEPLEGPVSPLGAMVDHQVSSRDQPRLHQFGNKDFLGIFLGYVLYAMRILKGDTPAADTEKLEKMDASEIHAGRLNAKEVLTLQNCEHFYIPDRRWKRKKKS